MLLKFGAKNFFCFKEGFEISFELGKGCPQNVSKGNKTTNLLCVKGKNGSGKTNALKVISFLNAFCSDSFSQKPEDDLFIDSYFFIEKPSDFFCDFEVGEVQYRYEASLTDKKVIGETIYRRRSRLSEVYKREENRVITCVQEFNDLKNIKLRSNASIISTAHQYEVNSIAPIYRFFSDINSNVNWLGRHELFPEYEEVAKIYDEDPEILSFSEDFIKGCDVGVNKMMISSREDETGKIRFYPVFEHDTNSKHKNLLYYNQSSGTQALFKILPLYFSVLKQGGVLVMDEFDINFHPDILPKLVDLFENKGLNSKNAQMIFTTHNTDIMDKMGKYRTVIIDQQDSESYGYRLDEIPGDIIRNDRSIASVYKTGKIGGVPRL